MRTAIAVSVTTNLLLTLLWLMITKLPFSGERQFYLWAAVVSTAFAAIVVILVEVLVEHRIKRHLEAMTVDQVKARHP